MNITHEMSFEKKVSLNVNKVKWLDYPYGYWTRGKKIDISFIVPSDYIATKFSDDEEYGGLQDKYSYFYFKYNNDPDEKLHFGSLSEKYSVSKKEAKGCMDRGEKYKRKEWKGYNIFYTILNRNEECTVIEEQEGTTIHGIELVNDEITIYEALFHEIKK